MPVGKSEMRLNDLGGRCLPLPGFLKFERQAVRLPFGRDFRLSAFAGLETRAAFGAWRRFAVVVAWLRDLVGLSPAFIACPKPQDEPSYRLKPAKGKGVRRLFESKQKSRLVFAASAARVKADTHRSWLPVREGQKPALYRTSGCGPSRMPLLFQN